MAGDEVDPGAAPVDSRDDDAASLQGFLDKWCARWPEWGVAEVFIPAAERGRVLAWGSLLQELTDAAWGGSDARPGLAKLGWWKEELQGWERGLRRHPLGIALQKADVSWGGFAAALDGLPAARERAGDADEALELVMPFAQAVARVEAGLFARAGEAGPATGSTDPDAGEVAVVAACLLQSRFFHGGDAHVPLTVMAVAGEGDPDAAWVAELRRRWPGRPSMHRPRRLWSALAQARLGAGDPRQPRSSWSTLWCTWKAARN